MASISPIDARDIDVEVWTTLDELHLKFAEIPVFARILAKSPSATRAFFWSEGALAHGRLSSRQRQQIALAVSDMNNSECCISAHAAIAKDTGLSEEEIQMARNGTSPDPKTAAILRFAQAVVLQHGETRDKDLKAVRAAGVSDSEVIETIANITATTFQNYLSNISRIEAPLPLLLPGKAADEDAACNFDNVILLTGPSRNGHSNVAFLENAWPEAKVE